VNVSEEEREVGGIKVSTWRNRPAVLQVWVIRGYVNRLRMPSNKCVDATFDGVGHHGDSVFRGDHYVRKTVAVDIVELDRFVGNRPFMPSTGREGSHRS